MKVLIYDIDRYGGAEADICNLHVVDEDNQKTDSEYNLLLSRFAERFPGLTPEVHYEIPEWHHQTRVLWAYLYRDDFYTSSFIPTIQELLLTMQTSWFAQFECYSPSLESTGNPNGFVGDFLIHKETAIFCESDFWPAIIPKLQIS